MATKLWSNRGGQTHAVTLDQMMWFDRQGQTLSKFQAGCLGIVAVAGCEGAVAALLVPDQQHGGVLRNGMAVLPGTQLLGHADEFVVHEHSFWTSADSQPDVTTFSPARHPADARCFLSKARLQDGEPITICPGQPGQPCGTIYKRAAWETVLAQNARFRCPNCSFDPRAPAWRPPHRKPRSSLAGVLSLLYPEKPR